MSFKKKKKRREAEKENGEGKKWVYPSPQMFYNAMNRKGNIVNAYLISS